MLMQQMSRCFNGRDAYMTRGLSYDNVKVVRRDLVKAMDTNRTKINELIQKLQELGLIN